MNENLYLSASVRGDVSSTMGDTEAREWYPKMAGSYQLGQLSVFDNLKFRVALGQTGNMPQSKSKYTTMGSSNIGGINGLVASSTRGNALLNLKELLSLSSDQIFLNEWSCNSGNNKLFKILKI